VVIVTGQPSQALDSETLEALRAARTSREAFQRRMLPFLVVIVVGVAYFSARQSPHLGLHGASLGLSVGLAGFVVGVLGVRQTMVSRSAAVRVYAPFLALLLLSSALLLWAQPTGPGASGCIVAISVAMIARVIPARLGMALVVITIGVAALVITETARPQERHQGFTGFLGTVLSFGGIFLYAMVVWRYRQHEEQSQRLLAQMEETRDAELRAAALSERQRLAREMHDVLAHSLSGLVVQLEGARLLALSDPTDGRLAVTIDRAHQLAKNGLDEARQAISMLRDDELPGPGQLAALARSFEADTGIRCGYVTLGEAREIGSAARLALYRVTQEALTNVRKHAHPDRVEVRLDYLHDALCLEVEDFQEGSGGMGPPGSGGFRGDPSPGQYRGYGLAGMRERAELLGGTLTAGPTGHGFLVRLRIPT
jgi:signal transduction histidine kinase